MGGAGYSIVDLTRANVLAWIRRLGRGSARGAVGAAALVIGSVFAGTPVSAAAAPRISITDTVVGESAGIVRVAVSLSAPSRSSVSVRFYAAGGTTASSLTDYRMVNGTITFAPGQRRKSIRVQILDDRSAEPLERLFISLTAPVNATIARPAGAVAIVDNDRRARTPRLVARGVIVDEKAHTAFVPVLLGGPAGQRSNRVVTVRYRTVNGTAAAGADYTATRGTLRFAPGDNVKHVPVRIRDDTRTEAAERFTLRLRAPTNAVIATARATVTIGASDRSRVAQPSISAVGAVVGERAGWVDVPVTLNAPSASVVSVDFVAAGGTTASSLTDYGLLNSTITFAPGETTEIIRVFILDDIIAEPLETLFIDLRAPVNATIGNTPGTVTIRDDD
jgi:chitinase